MHGEPPMSHHTLRMPSHTVKTTTTYHQDTSMLTVDMVEDITSATKTPTIVEGIRLVPLRKSRMPVSKVRNMEDWHSQKKRCLLTPEVKNGSPGGNSLLKYI